MIELPAKCPHCDSGCEKCVDGKIVVNMPEDDWYTRHCLNPLCGFDNGGCQGSALREENLPCVMCGHSDVAWIPMCESSPDPPWKINQAETPMAKYLIAIESQMGEPDEGYGN